ncbi:MAG: oligosaccharide flippase family protein [Acidimicrobiia bacterium]|nr:oligosaccharide flippase family protein [Acidimicrobiia bacterium]
MTTQPPLGRALAWSTVASGLSRVIGAVGGVFAAHALNPAGRGDLAVLVVLSAIGSIVSAAGLQFWITREVARTGSVAVGAAVALRHSLIVAGGFVALAVVAGPFLVGPVLPLNAYVATVASAATGSMALAALALPNGTRSMGVFAIAMTTSSAAYAIGVGALLVLGTGDVAAILWCGALGNLVSIAVVLRWFRLRTEPRDISRRERAAEWRRGLRFGLPGGIGELVLFGMLRVDLLVLAALRPAAEVGAYAIATSLTEMLWIIADASAHVALPTAADTNGQHAGTPLTAMFRVAMAVGVLSAVVLSLFARPIIDRLFGPGYAEGAAAVPYLALAAILGGGWKILSAEVMAGHGTRARLTSAGAGIVVMITADFVLIPSHGVRGAGMAAALGYFAAAALMVGVWSQTTGRSGRELLGLRRNDLAGLALRHGPEGART